MQNFESLPLTSGFAANASSSAMSKAAAIARAVNGSSFGTAMNLLEYVTALSQQPAGWFNLSATFVGIDPPGQSAGNMLESKHKWGVQTVQRSW